MILVCGPTNWHDGLLVAGCYCCSNQGCCKFATHFGTGHGPFSHLFDGRFIPRVLPGTKWKVSLKQSLHITCSILFSPSIARGCIRDDVPSSH